MMKKFHVFSRGVTALHTHTHARGVGIQRVRAFVLILFLLMIKVDVGWGQGGSCNNCTNSISNNNVEMDLEVNPVNGKGQASFQYGFVSNWYSAFNTPHHIQYNSTSNPVICDLLYANSNNTEIPCLATHKSGYSEGIFTNSSILFANDGFETYCISLDVQKLLCSNYNHEMVVDVRLGTGIDPWQIGNIDNQAVNLFNNNTLILHSEAIDNNDLKSINLTFDLNQNSNWYDQVMINTRKPVPTGTIREEIFVTLNNVNVSCSTTALEGLSAVILPNNNVEFSAIYNAGAFNGIDTYFWNFGDGTTSTLANPSHQFNGPGPYNVCLDIVNTNGCCASICSTITAEECNNTCQDQIVNNDLELGPNTPTPLPNGHSENTFQNLYVPNGPNNMWWASHGTPHHTQFQASGCTDIWTVQNGSEVPCLRAAVGLLSEGFYTRINTNFDPLLDYCLSLTLHNLACNNTPGSQDIIVALAKDLTPVPPNVTIPNPPSIPRQVLIQRRFASPNYQEETVNVRFNMNQNMFNQLWIYAQAVTFKTTSSVSNVNLSCTTRALTDIITNQVTDLKWRFIAENASAVSTFVSHNWTITNTADNSVVFTSIQANPEFIFSGSGTYNVCVDIIDNNGCCATLCEEIVVACDDLVANFTITGTCPNFTFAANNLSEGNTYSWVINGQQVGTNGVLPFIFTENGTYTIELTVTNECGETKSYSLTLTIDCICDDPVGDFNFNVACINGQGQVTFNVTNGLPGDTYVWNFGDWTANVTTTSPSIIHTYTGNQTYAVTLTITNSCNKSKTVQKNVVVMCQSQCNNPNGNPMYLLDGSNGPITLSQAFTNLGITYTHASVNAISNLNFEIRGDVVIDISAIFNKCHFLAWPGAQLILQPTLIPASPVAKGTLTFIGCEFYGCTHMWKGIRDDGPSVIFLGGKINDALYGIHANNSGALTVNSVSFAKNFVGMYYTSSPSQTVVGNTFTGGGLLPGYNGLPGYATKNLAGVVADGAFGLSIGNKSSNKNNFQNLSNGIICNNVWNISIHNNKFKDLIGSNFDQNRANLLTGSEGNGIIINGLGLFGTSIEKNEMENGYHGISIRNTLYAFPRIKDQNKIKNFFYGINVEQNFSPNLEISNQNEVDCKLYGIRINEAGINFNANGNTIKQSAGIAQDGSIGFIVSSTHSSNYTGFGTVAGNIFDITHDLTNGSLGVSQFNKIEITGLNKFFQNAYRFSNNGHFGLNLENVNSALVDNNEFRNTGGGRLGRNQLRNVSKSAVCCNETYDYYHGFHYFGSSTGRSSFLKNKMENNFRGLNLTQSCAIGEQKDKGNSWSGGIRLARYSGINTLNNSFFAKQSQNTSLKSYWPSQSPAVWFGTSDVDASDTCDLYTCEVPLGSSTPQSEPLSGDIEILERMLDHGHIVDEAHLAPGAWRKERWLYGYLTKHPQFLAASDILSQFYQNASDDITAYEHFYKQINDAHAITEGTKNQLDLLRMQAQSITDLQSIKWNTYQETNNANVLEELNELKSQILPIQNSALQLNALLENTRSNQIAELGTLVSSLPDDQPYTAAAKLYAQILTDYLTLGDTYVSQHHMPSLQYLAYLCEPLYKETVILARNMLANLQVYQSYDDESLCANVENRYKENDVKEDVTIHPNPSTGLFYLTTVGNVLRYNVKDVSGQLLKSVDGKETKCDLTEFSAGIYFITLHLESGSTVTKKVVKLQ